MPQTPVRGPLCEAHLDDQPRLDPMRAARARQRPDTRRRLALVGLERAPDRDELLLREAAADAPDVAQRLAIARCEVQRAEAAARTARRAPADDRKIARRLDPDLAPRRRTTGAIRRVRALRRPCPRSRASRSPRTPRDRAPPSAARAAAGRRAAPAARASALRACSGSGRRSRSPTPRQSKSASAAGVSTAARAASRGVACARPWSIWKLGRPDGVVHHELAVEHGVRDGQRGERHRDLRERAPSPRGRCDRRAARDRPRAPRSRDSRRTSLRRTSPSRRTVPPTPRRASAARATRPRDALAAPARAASRSSSASGDAFAATSSTVRPEWIELRRERRGRAREGVGLLDQQPLLRLRRVALALRAAGSHQREATPKLVAVEIEEQLALRDSRFGIFDRRPSVPCPTRSPRRRRSCLPGSIPRSRRSRAGGPRRAPRDASAPDRATVPSAPPTTTGRPAIRGAGRSGGGGRGVPAPRRGAAVRPQSRRARGCARPSAWRGRRRVGRLQNAGPRPDCP